MFYFILINFGLLFLCSATQPPKFCVNCKYFITSADTFFPFFFGEKEEFGRCALFKKVYDYDDYFLVTGISKDKPIEYNYCSIARKYDKMCGWDAKYFEKKK